MTTSQYDYGIGTETSRPVLLESTLEQALDRLERLQKRYGERLIIWRRPRPEWEIIPD